jgi:hypothetical protein
MNGPWELTKSVHVKFMHMMERMGIKKPIRPRSLIVGAFLSRNVNFINCLLGSLHCFHSCCAGYGIVWRKRWARWSHRVRVILGWKRPNRGLQVLYVEG